MEMTTKELCRRSGITLRQAQTWSEKGILLPEIQPIRGLRQRVFSGEDLFKAKVLKALKRKGVSLEKAAPMLQHNWHKLESMEYIVLGIRSGFLATMDDARLVCVAVSGLQECAVVLDLRGIRSDLDSQ